MRDITEAMVQALRDELKTFKSDDVLRTALSAALSKQTLPVRVEVSVKPLIWRAYGNQHLKGWQGVGRMGYLAYVTNIGPDGEEGWFFDNRQHFDTADDAKAAAQSDYETRIRSALVDVPAVEPEPAAWQWRSRIKGGAWDAWENGRYGQQVPPFMDAEERPLYAHPPRSALVNADVVERLTEALKTAAQELDRISCVPTVTETTDIYDQFERARFFANRGASSAWTALKAYGTGGGEQ
jgi:hypothetical protein